MQRLRPRHLLINREGEPVTPNQVNLLKILDSYLQHDKQNVGFRDSRKTDTVHFVTSVFFSLSRYAQNAMLRALGPEDAYGDTALSDEHQAQSTTAEPGIQLSGMNESAAGQKELDLLLPQVCAAIVLNSQCLISMLLAEEPSQPPNYPALALTKRSDGSDRDDRPTRRCLLGASDSGSLAFIESLIGELCDGHLLSYLRDHDDHIVFHISYCRDFAPARHNPSTRDFWQGSATPKPASSVGE